MSLEAVRLSASPFLQEQSRSGESPLSYDFVLRTALLSHESAILGAYAAVFDGSTAGAAAGFRHEAARLVAVQMVRQQLIRTITLISGGRSLSDPEETVTAYLERSNTSPATLDARATQAWESLLGVHAAAALKPATNQNQRDMILGSMSEAGMTAVLHAAEHAVAETLNAGHTTRETRGRIRRATAILQSAGAAERVHDAFEGRADRDLQQTVNTLAGIIEPMLFTRTRTQAKEFAGWQRSKTAEHVRRAMENGFTIQYPGRHDQTAVRIPVSAWRQARENAWASPRLPKNDTLGPAVRKLMAVNFQERTLWNKLTPSGKAATELLLVFLDAPVGQKTRMFLEDPQLARTWAYLSRHAGPELRQALSAWIPAGEIARAVTRSAQVSAREQTGVKGRIERLGMQMSRPPLPAITRAEKRNRLLVPVFGLAIAGIILSACGPALPSGTPSPTPRPGDGGSPTPGPTHENTPTPAPVDLVASHQTLAAALSNFHVAVQCTFPQADVAGNAPYIASLDAQLPAFDAALAAPAPVDLSRYTLICDGTTQQVYLKGSDNTYLLPGDSGLARADMGADNRVRILAPTETPVPELYTKGFVDVYSHGDQVTGIHMSDLPALLNEIKTTQTVWFSEDAPKVNVMGVGTGYGITRDMIFCPAGSIKLIGTVRIDGEPLEIPPYVYIFIINTSDGPRVIFDYFYSSELYENPHLLPFINSSLLPDGSFSSYYQLNIVLALNKIALKNNPRDTWYPTLLATPAYAQAVQLADEAARNDAFPAELEGLILMDTGF